MAWSSNRFVGITASVVSAVAFSANTWDATVGNLELESGGNLLQEDNSLILLEQQYG